MIYVYILLFLQLLWLKKDSVVRKMPAGKGGGGRGEEPEEEDSPSSSEYTEVLEEEAEETRPRQKASCCLQPRLQRSLRLANTR